MHIRALNSWDSPSSIGVFTEHTLFDPRVNKTFRVSPNSITAQQFLDHLKVLYTPANVQANPKELIGGWANITSVNPHKASVYLTTLIEAAGDNLWALNFLSFESLQYHEESREYSRPSLYIYKARPGRNESREHFYPSCADDFKTHTKPWDSVLGKTWLKDQFAHIAEAWATAISEVSERPCYKSMFWGHSMLARTFGHWYTGQQFIHDDLNGGRGRSPSQALTLLDDNPALTMRYRLGDYGDAHYSLIIPLSPANRTALYRVHSYTTNVMQILEGPITCKNEYDPVLYGVELECATSYSIRELMDAQDKLYMIGKQDSSISGAGATKVELVTLPMSLKAHRQQWAKWFSKLDYAKFDCTNQTNNGMHVHVGRNCFRGPGHIRNFIWFINNPAHFDFMLAVSERDAASLRQWAPMMPVGRRMSKVKAFKESEAIARNVRGATNVSKPATVEVRLFKGIVSYASVLKNLEVVDAIFHYTAEMAVTDTSLQSFLKWLNNTPKNKYTVFKKFLSETKNLDNIVYGARVKDILWLEDEPSKMVQLLEKSQLPIDNALVTFLNKSRKKRVFVLDKATKKITVLQTNLGKIAAMDRDLEKRYLNVA